MSNNTLSAEEIEIGQARNVREFLAEVRAWLGGGHDLVTEARLTKAEEFALRVRAIDRATLDAANARASQMEDLARRCNDEWFVRCREERNAREAAEKREAAALALLPFIVEETATAQKRLVSTSLVTDYYPPTRVFERLRNASTPDTDTVIAAAKKRLEESP